MVNKYHKQNKKESGGLITKIYNATLNKSNVTDAATDVRNRLEGNSPKRIMKKYRQKKNPRN